MKRIFITLTIIGCALQLWAEGPHRRYHDDIRELRDSTILFTGLHSPLASQAIEVRAALPKATEGAPLEAFSVLWSATSDGTEYYRATLRPVDRMPDDVFDQRYVMMTIDHHTEQSDSVIAELQLRDGFGLERSENTLGVEINFENRSALIYGGNGKPKRLAEIEMRDTIYPTVGVQAEGTARLSLLVTEETEDIAGRLSTGMSRESLSKLLEGKSLPQGIYRYLDRQNDSRYARPGGSYTLAVVESSKGGYDLIYLDGARVGADRWKEGMIKGHLSPTVFQNHYDLTWYDAEMKPMTEECSADIEQDVILTLNFPLLKSQMRFSQMDK